MIILIFSGANFQSKFLLQTNMFIRVIFFIVNEIRVYVLNLTRKCQNFRCSMALRTIGNMPKKTMFNSLEPSVP